jgi:hypothetical protein
MNKLGESVHIEVYGYTVEIRSAQPVALEGLAEDFGFFSQSEGDCPDRGGTSG